MSQPETTETTPSTTEEKKEEQVALVIDPKIQEEVNKYMDEQGTKFLKKNFEKLITMNEYTYNGQVFKAKMLSFDEIDEFDKLLENAPLDKSDKKLWREFLYKKATMLIEDMDEKKFRETPAVITEALVTAWSLKHQGFCEL